MKVILIGGGRTGFNLGRRLIANSHEVAIVEKDEERANKLSKELDALIIHGTGTNLEVLEKAGIKKADALAALTPNDETNLMISKLAKNFDISRVVARVNETKHAEMFEDVGADATISSVTSTVGLFEKAITGPGIFGLLSLGGKKADVIEVTVSEDSPVIGKSIKELDLPELCTIATITRDDVLAPPRGNTVLKEDDRVILAGDPEEITPVGKLFRGKTDQIQTPSMQTVSPT